MSDPFAGKIDHDKLTAPLLYLSSENCDWDYLKLHAFHEPNHLNNWIEPIIPEVSLVMLTHGKMMMEQERQNGTWNRWAVHQGDIFLKPAGASTKPLNWKSLSKQPMATIHIRLDQTIILRAITELVDKDNTLIHLTRHTGLRDGIITQIMLSLHKELLHPSPVSKLYADSAAQMLAVHLLRHYAEDRISIDERSDKLSTKQIKRIKDYVHAHLSSNISLDDLADLLAFSPYHFARIFRESTGYTPYQFVMHQRIERAKYLLKQSNLSLAQIAIETGFSHQSHFTQVFKRQIGITPSVYRKR